MPGKKDESNRPDHGRRLSKKGGKTEHRSGFVTATRGKQDRGADW
jgi:hypothetical protein